jgi:hypothetical protein
LFVDSHGRGIVSLGGQSADGRWQMAEEDDGGACVRFSALPSALEFVGLRWLSAAHVPAGRQSWPRPLRVHTVVHMIADEFQWDRQREQCSNTASSSPMRPCLTTVRL